jgi:uncharacterized alpha-E superfamily protein
MLSRVANSIYWLNRYIERAENIARFVDVNLNLLLDSIVVDDRQWEPIVVTTGDLEIFRSRYGEATAKNVVQFLTYDEKYPNSILSCLQLARENARSIQEIISSEMWEQVNSFYLMVKDAAAATIEPELPEFLAAVKMASHQFAGVMDATMSHNEGWHFGQIGRSIERADKTARILDVKYFIILPSPTDIARFLIFDRQFPRSILYCLNATEKCLYLISGNHLDTGCNLAERQLGKLRSELDFLSIEEVIAGGLHEFLDRTQSRLNNVSQEITNTFLTIDDRVAL